jgi:hypothetical protein
VIVGVVAPVDQLKLLPVAEIVDVPHPFVTVVVEADGIAIGAATPVPAELVHPLDV